MASAPRTPQLDFFGLGGRRTRRIFATVLLFVSARAFFGADAVANVAKKGLSTNKNGAANDGGDSDESFCEKEGSLHQIALDMINHSSPPGSKSYEKFKRILSMSPIFYLNMGNDRIFSMIQLMMKRMLEGIGMQALDSKPPSGLAALYANITLVETTFTASICELRYDECRDMPRIYMQTEQIIKWEKIDQCHKSPNCVILEFSDGNREDAKGYKAELEDSYVLLPVMTQTPSRISPWLPETPNALRNRTVDMAFLGEITNRRTLLVKGAAAYREAHPDRSVWVMKNHNQAFVGRTYNDAKVCLVMHSFKSRSGGEYHRVSEFAPYGCIPVVEHFSDKLGISTYERCAGVVFANSTELFPVAEDVVAKIDRGLYDDRLRAIVKWWKEGIHWERILPTVFGVESLTETVW